MTDQLFPTGGHGGEWDIDAARDTLRKQLDDVRGIEGFPTGTDDAIVNASLPPYHTTCPNPFLAEWIERVRTEDDDRPDPGPFATDVKVGKGNRYYKAHSYPTKVPYPAIMRFLLHFTKPNDVVLDGFSGTGATGLAAQACGDPEPKVREGIEAELGNVSWGARRAVLSDLSPFASIIAAGLNLPVDAQAFDNASADMLDRFDAELGWMYCTTHSNGQPASIEYTVWSEVFSCGKCAAAIVFYEVAFNPSSQEVADTFRCSSCGAEQDKSRMESRFTTVRTPLGDTVSRIEMRPVRIHYKYAGRRYDKSPDDGDQAILDRIAGMPLHGDVPSHEVPFMHMTHERAPMDRKGFQRVHHYWGDRALHALSWLWREAGLQTDPLVRFACRFWIEQAFWGLSWQNRYRPEGYSQVSQYQSGVYYAASLHSECSVRYNLEGSKPSVGKRRSLVKAWTQSPATVDNVVISAGSSVALNLPDDSIDYVFVDPPFGKNIYYADLAYLTEAWYGVYTEADAEAIENQSKVVPRTLAEYGQVLGRCFQEFFRVLKPGRWMTVEFSNSNNRVWLTVQRALEGAGFLVADTRILDKKQLSYRQVTSGAAAKKDLVISCYKPTIPVPDLSMIGDGDPATAWAFIEEHLSKLQVVEGRRGESVPIRERMADRLYDRMIAYHVSRKIPVPLTTTEFYEGLDQRFPVRDGMYFLDTQVETYERHRLTFKELLADTLFITGESSAVQWLRQYLKSRGRPLAYSDIQPAFLSELGNSLAEWEQLPELRELLAENFIQDDDGRWYVPDPKKAADLEKLRKRALLREFESITAGTGRITAFRSEAVRAGFDDAWDRQEFDLIVDVGRRLPADALVDDQTLRYYVDNAEMLAR